jgi:transcriptional regulator with XRE-family HTH domain
MSQEALKNICGREVCRFRTARKWTQDKLATELNLLGWEDISRIGIAKIEGGSRNVNDRELRFLADALKVSADALLKRV